MSDPETIASALSRHRTHGHIASLLGGHDNNLELIIALLEKFGPVSSGALLSRDNIQFALQAAVQHGRTDLIHVWLERYGPNTWDLEYVCIKAAAAGDIDAYEQMREKYQVPETFVTAMLVSALQSNQLLFIRHLQRDARNEKSPSNLGAIADSASMEANFDLALEILDELEQMSDEHASIQYARALTLVLCNAIDHQRFDILADLVGRRAIAPYLQRHLYLHAFSAGRLDGIRIVDGSINRSNDAKMLIKVAAQSGLLHCVNYVLESRPGSLEFVGEALVVAARRSDSQMVHHLYPLVTSSQHLFHAALLISESDLFLTPSRAFWNRTN